MYLKKIAVENVGPINRLRVELPFRDGLPLPLILVGPNGSGKSTLLSFILNALVGFKHLILPYLASLVRGAMRHAGIPPLKAPSR